MDYLIQCIAGLQDLVLDRLRHDLPSVAATMVEEGFLAFASPAPVAAVRALPYVNNAFAVLRPLQGAETDALVAQLAQDRGWRGAARALTERHERRFRVFVSDEGRLVSGGRAMAALVDRIAAAAGLAPARNADTEFWLLRRRGGQAFLAKRLTRRHGTEKTLRAGELRPQLALLMCLLSEPAGDDVVLDSFCGTGALPLARMALPYNMIFALDEDREKVAALRRQLREGKVRPRKGAPVIVAAADARRLDRFEAAFVHKVVTDPPWGQFDRTLDDVAGLYRAFLAELARIVRPGGLAVLLLGDRALVTQLGAEQGAAFAVERSFDLLVNGRKAALVRWRRR